jgi:uncharacterized MAPEG superfamily protein
MSLLAAILASAGILIILTLVQGAIKPITYGFAWGLGSRDETPEQTPILGRFERAIQNHIEAMLAFVPIAFVGHLLEVNTASVFIASAIFVAARVCFSASYIAGIFFIRSAFYGLSLGSTLWILYAVVTALLA